MGYGYSKRRVDNNHKQLISELRSIYGKHNVLDTHTLPKFCDCVVGHRGRSYLVEIKTDKKSKLTQDEQIINDNYVGAYIVATTSEDVINYIDEDFK